MYALHDLLNRDARVLNRHARKMYGFLPGLVTAVTDPKQKRHQRGFVKVCFPGLQDVEGPDAPILPWARLVTQNAGGMIEPKKTEKKKFKKQIWTRTPREVPFEIMVETEEPVYEEIEEEQSGKDPVRKDETYQIQVKAANFKSARPAAGDTPDSDIWDGGSSKAACDAECAKIAAKAQEALKDSTDDSQLVIHIDGHTDTQGWSGDEAAGDDAAKNGWEGNQALSDRRANLVSNMLVVELNKLGGDVAGKTSLRPTGFGESEAGDIRDKENPDSGKMVTYPAANPGSKAAKNSAKGVSDVNCRRVDVTFSYRLVKCIPGEKKIVKKKVQIGVKKVLKPVKGSRTVYDTKSEIVEVEIDVPVPGKPSGTGVYAPPQIGDEVLCAFEHGDMHFPYVIGSLWNGKAKLPEPTTPADDKRDKKGPQTPDMKGDSLCGGGGKNKIGYFKSRTGNLVSLDDNKGVVRMQDRGGMSTVQLSKGKIEIIQSSGNIWVFADQKIRIDCKDMIVNAQKNIWQHATNNYGVKAGKNQSITVKGTWAITSKGGKATEGVKGIKFKCTGGDIKVGADKMVAITGKGSHNQGGAGVSMQALGGDMGVASKDDQLDIDAKGNIMILSPMKICYGAEGDLSLKADGMINMSGLTNIKWKGAEALLNSGGAPPGAITLGSIIGAVIRGAQALAGAVASAAGAVGNAVAGAAKAAAGAVANAASAATSALGKVVGAVTNAVNNAGAAIMNGAKALANTALNAGKAMMNAAQNVVNGAVNMARNAAGAVVDMAKQVGEKVVGGVKAAGNLVVQGAQAIAQKAQQAVAFVGAAAQNLAQNVMNAGQQLANGVRNLGQQALDGAKGLADKAVDMGKAAVQQVQDGVQAMQNGAQAAFKGLKDVAGQAAGAVKDGVDKMGQAVDRGMAAVQNGAQQFAQGVGNAVNDAGKALDNAAGQARDFAAQAAQDARNKVADGVEGAGKAVADGIRGGPAQAGGPGNGEPNAQQAQRPGPMQDGGVAHGMGNVAGGGGQAAQQAGGGGQGAGQGGQGAGQAGGNGVGLAQQNAALPPKPKAGPGQVDWKGLPAPAQMGHWAR